MQKHNKKELRHSTGAFNFFTLEGAFKLLINTKLFYCYRSPPVLHGPGSKKKVQLVGAAGSLSGAAKKHALRITLIETFS
jgi:hypothetical protein